MASFGIVEGITTALKRPAEELNRRLDRIARGLELQNELQQTTNRLLEEARLDHQHVVGATVGKKPSRPAVIKKESPND